MASYMYNATEDAVRYPLKVENDFWHRFMEWVPRMPDPPIRTPTDQEAKDDPTNVATRHYEDARHQTAPRDRGTGGRDWCPVPVTPVSHLTDTASPEEEPMYQAIVSPQESKFIAAGAGQQAAMQLPSAYYADLADIADSESPVLRVNRTTQLFATSWTSESRLTKRRGLMLTRGV